MHSPTRAMSDVFHARAADVDRCVKGFQRKEGQRGLMVFIDGKVVGFDVLSRNSAYEQLHAKLIKSYAMEALLAKTEEKGETRPTPQEAEAFLGLCRTSEQTRYESVGYGQDYRFQGPSVVGSALIHWETIVHMAFFRIDEADRAGGTSSYRRRRSFRL